MKLITREDIVKKYGLSLEAVTKLLNTKGCPLLPRKKGQIYRVPEEPFENWLMSQTKK